MTAERVVHLVDPSAPDGGPCTLRIVDACAEDDVIVLGTADDDRSARRCGLKPRGHLSRRWLSAKRGLQRLCAGATLIHAWSARAGVLAAVAAPRQRRVATLTLPPFKGIGWAGVPAPVARRMLMRGTALRCTSAAVRDGCAAIGLSAEVISVSPVAGVGDASRESLRRRWGADGAFMVGLSVEPCRWADVRTAAAVTARVAATGRDIRLVAHPAGAGRNQAIRWLRSLDLADDLILDDLAAEPWSVLPGLDAMFHVGAAPRVSALPLHWALVAGVPVLADDGPEVREIVDSGASARIVDCHDINKASQALLEIIRGRF